MIDYLYRLLFGKNSKYTSANTIKSQLNERRPLPVGKLEFEEWSKRIMSGALISASSDTQINALAIMIMSLGPHESHKEDAYFIHGLRKSAANQVADEVRKELYANKKAKEELDKIAKEATEVNKQAEATLERAKGLSLVKEAPVLDNK
jgi:hypothetical protein